MEYSSLVTRAPLAGIDLNLLLTLDALLDEVSVTRAAVRLEVTQSAASHALNRLRAQFDDPLLVRQAGHMTLTPLGELLRPRVRKMLEGIDQLLTARTEFCPARSIRRFSILASDYAQVVALPSLLARLRALAPGIDLHVRAVADPERALAEGDDELMIGPERETIPTLIRQRLFTDRLVCVARRGHPALTEELTLDRYLEARHVLVAPRGQPGSIVDEELRRLGAERRVLLQIPHFLVAPIVVAESDLLLTVPERLAQRVAKGLGLTIASLPFAAPPIHFVQLWHPRYQEDPAHVWLRSTVAESLHGSGS